MAFNLPPVPNYRHVSPLRRTLTHHKHAQIQHSAGPVKVGTHQQSLVQSHESCRFKSLDVSCLNFVSHTPVFGRDGRNGCRENYSLVKDHGAIYRTFVVNTGTASYFNDDDVHNNINNSTINNSNNVLIVIGPSV